MGMFDYIAVEVPLPDGVMTSEEEYQTKSLECLMYKYVITKNGELYREKWDYEWVDDESHFLGGYEKKIEGSYRREYLTNFHGDIIFYNGRVNGKWRDYTARFTNGKLSSISYQDYNY